jgi:hypothetical protein
VVWQVAAARAQSLDAGLSFCETTNCSAIVLGGIINQHIWNLSGGSTTQIPHTGAGSWVMPVRAGLAECLRLDILSQSTRLELVVVSPSGVVWRNAGRGGNGPCPTCPLVAIDGTNQSGYYIVQVNQHEGAPVDGLFELAYGRWPRPNPNCTPATPPLN